MTGLQDSANRPFIRGLVYAQTVQTETRATRRGSTLRHGAKKRRGTELAEASEDDGHK